MKKFKENHFPLSTNLLSPLIYNVCQGSDIVKQVVYVDVLLTTNLFINYFLLLSCAKLLKKTAKRLRLFFGAAFGAAVSLSIFLPEMSFFSGLVFKAVTALTIVYIAFGAAGFKNFIKLFLAFIAANFIFAGSMMALWLMFKPGGMVVNNSIVYFDISVPVLIISTVICYGFVGAVSKIVARRSTSNIEYDVTIFFDSLSVTGKGYLDTGNTLTDCFSGFPVIVAKRKFTEKLFFPEELECFRGNSTFTPSEGRLKSRIRIIPFGTIKEQGIIKAFRPDYIIIEKDKVQICKTREVYVAVSDGNFSSLQSDVLLNPKIFDTKEM